MAATQQAAALVAAHVIPALRLAAQVLSYFYLLLDSVVDPDTDRWRSLKDG
jgi:hypothetical protein